MEDTHCGENCPYKKMGFEKCPNEMETWWQPSEGGEPKLVKDCAPKRTVLMLQQLTNRVFGLQKQQVECSNHAQGVVNEIKKIYQNTVEDFGCLDRAKVQEIEE